MRYPLLSIALLICLFENCKPKNDPKATPFEEAFNCSKGLMKPAFYERGTDGPIPSLKNIPDSFLILLDTNLTATNFISFQEDFFRSQSINPDTDIYFTDPEKLTKKEKLEKLKKVKISNKQQADSVHKINNNGQLQVWIINNSRDTVSIKMQDWSYICILQGLSKGRQWLPVQYWQFSSCGNSYFDKQFAPQTANSFIFTIPNKGDYQTKLRFKLLGTNKFYYSNEFTGKIDYCQFVEDSSDYYPLSPKPQPHYKLENLWSK
jgi:hypothetical protein